MSSAKYLQPVFCLRRYKKNMFTYNIRNEKMWPTFIGYKNFLLFRELWAVELVSEEISDGKLFVLPNTGVVKPWELTL